MCDKCDIELKVVKVTKDGIELVCPKCKNKTVRKVN